MYRGSPSTTGLFGYFISETLTAGVNGAENGLIMRAVGDSMILCPPLIISKPQIDEMAEKIGMSLDQALSKLKGH